MLKFLKRHSWVLTCFLAIVLIPQSLTLQSKLEGRLIITGLAIDKQGDEYLITAQAVSPSSGVISGSDSAGIDFISSNAKTVREAITKLSTTAAKSPGLGFLNFVIIGESLFGEDITSTIDFIVRDSHTDTSVLMLVAKNASEVIKKTKTLELGSATQLRKLFLSKQSMSNGTMTITNKFLSSKFEPSASSVVSYFEIYNEPEIDISNQTESQTQPSANENSSQSQDSNSKSSETPIKQGRVKYNLPLSLFRDGRYRCALESADEIFGFNLLCRNSNNLICGFSDLSEDDGTRTKITLLSKSKKTKISVRIENNIPIIEAKIVLEKNQLLEQIPEETKLDNYKTQQNYLADSMKTEIESQIINKAKIAFEKARQNQVDLLEAATKLHRHNKKAYDKYFKSHTLNDFLNNAQIKITAEVGSITK